MSLSRLTAKRLDRQAMVITGATSGVGLATARMAASRGACVVHVARGEADLREVTGSSETGGGQAIVRHLVVICRRVARDDASIMN